MEEIKVVYREDQKDESIVALSNGDVHHYRKDGEVRIYSLNPYIDENWLQSGLERIKKSS